jgi:hypothetical protein
MVVVVVVLCLASGSEYIGKISASTTMLSSLICLAEILFYDGFTNTVGRAAGLSIDPNVAAQGLILGAVATYRMVPKYLVNAYLILVGAAIVATLSRSSILVASLLLAIKLVDVLVRGRNNTKLDNWSWSHLDSAVLMMVLIWLLTVGAVNSRFIVAANSSFNGILTATDIFNSTMASARNQLNKLRRIDHLDPDDTADGNDRTSDGRFSFESALQSDIRRQAAAAPDNINSASARAVLFATSLQAVRTGPPLGIGLMQAHRLRPHNTFLLFGVAFGFPGLFVPLGLVLCCFWYARSVDDALIGIALAGTMFFSHDVLIMPGLIIAFTVGLSYLVKDRLKIGNFNHFFIPAISVLATSTLAASIGCFFVLQAAHKDGTIKFDSTKIAPVTGNAYSTNIMPQFSGLLRIGLLNQNTNGQLYEDGQKISSRISSSNDIIEYGRGRFSQLSRDVLLFSASDNTDPIINRRSYEVLIPIVKHPLSMVMLFLLVSWLLASSALLLTDRNRQKAI